MQGWGKDRGAPSLTYSDPCGKMGHNRALSYTGTYGQRQDSSSLDSWLQAFHTGSDMSVSHCLVKACFPRVRGLEGDGCRDHFGSLVGLEFPGGMESDISASPQSTREDRYRRLPLSEK